VVVDVLGLLVCVVVHSAALQDRVGAKQVLSKAQPLAPRVRLVWADGGYTGTLAAWLKETSSWELEIVKRNELHVFKVLPRRWVVERTFGWFMKWRCLNRHHARKPETVENDLCLVMTKIMLRRLANQKAAA
jgi:transposase